MNAENNDKSKELEKTDGSATKEKTGSSSSLLAIILALLALAVACGSVYYNYRSQNDVARQTTAQNKFTAQLQQLDNSLSGLVSKRAEISHKINMLNESQQALQESLDALYQKQDRNSLDWTVAEIEHLMIIATHSLTLDKNTDAALAALEAADDRLRNLRDPGLIETRKQLASDMNALRDIHVVDITGLSLYLADLVNRVEKLPLQEQNITLTTEQDEQQATETMPAWKQLLLGVWGEIKGLVVITRSGSAGQAMLLPEENYFLYQNLRLQLESARTAAFRQDTVNFHASVKITLEWLHEYFDTSNNAVDNIIQSLTDMLELELQPTLPDISSSLETLHVYIKSRSSIELPGINE